jgi:hypothetical protein
VTVSAETASSMTVLAQPITGRKHQIRVHLAARGAPILGDVLYGANRLSAGRLMLHAERLVLDHPVTGRRLEIMSPRPIEFTANDPPTRSAGPREASARSTRPASGPPSSRKRPVSPVARKSRPEKKRGSSRKHDSHR